MKIIHNNFPFFTTYFVVYKHKVSKEGDELSLLECCSLSLSVNFFASKAPWLPALEGHYKSLLLRSIALADDVTTNI